MYRLFMTTGYDLSERQLRVYLDKFGKLSDLYLPKRADGRSKGFVFATFTTKKALSSAMRQPQHVVDGVIVEVTLVDSACQNSADTLLDTSRVKLCLYKMSPDDRAHCR